MNKPSPVKSTAPKWAPGQRWMSTAEPELGLGTIISFANRRIELFFDTHATSRTFAVDTAPLQRIIFTPGSMVEDCAGERFTVVSVNDDPESGLVTYVCDEQSLREDELSDTLAFSTPDQRLMAGIADDISAFALRRSMLEYEAALGASPIRGFTGGRIDLIPHQLYIAQKATSNANVRILLADETGLGKTIEACLILHRLITTGQVGRALILVPDALVHQWFVELLRRFNLLCRLFSDESIEVEDMDDAELFEDDPIWICSITMLRRHHRYAEQMLASEWDLVIVDEAHHISETDPFFTILDKLSSATPSMILLSATPEQFGRKGHLARLKLLDPARYQTSEDPAGESRRLQLLSSCIGKHIKASEDPVSAATVITLSEKLRTLLYDRQKTDGTEAAAAPIPERLSIGRLIDLFGAGRAYFRNTRRTIAGFPKRVAEITRLDAPQEVALTSHATWIAAFLKKYTRRKVLVITSTTESAQALRDAIQKMVSLDVALFHESMTLLQRDRQAAWFAEEDGARMLICNESGSEGRNFQFCSDLILLDIPWNPELLEQRIGRLDRIGQKSTIRIHLPVIARSSQDILCTWYHEAANVFEKNVPAAVVVFEESKELLRKLTKDPDFGTVESSSAFRELVATSRARVDELSKDLFNHRDYLLEFASNNEIIAQKLITAIEAESVDGYAEKIIIPLFDHYGIKLEEAGSNRTALITEFCTDHSFPLPRAERPVITFDRQTAYTYDTVEFCTIDHPMVTGALDLFLSSPHGTSTFALWNDLTTTELLLESLYVIECIAPAAMRIFRFFTPAPLRTVVNHHGQPVTDQYPEYLLAANCKNGPVDKLVSQKQLIYTTFPRLVSASDTCTDALVAPIIKSAQENMHQIYNDDRMRLIDLRAQGAPVTPQDLLALDNEERALHEYLAAARVRRDAVRLIWRGAVKGS